MKKSLIIFLTATLVVLNTIAVAAQSKEYVNLEGSEDFKTDEIYLDTDDKISREEFVEMAMQCISYIDNIIDIDSNEPVEEEVLEDTDNVQVINAYKLGVINGYGNGMFLPNNKINKAEVSQILYNICKRYEFPILVNELLLTEDANDFSLPVWSKHAFNYVYSANLLPDKDNNEQTYTSDECVDIFNRLISLVSDYCKISDFDSVVAQFPSKHVYLCSNISNNSYNCILYSSGQTKKLSMPIELTNINTKLFVCDLNSDKRDEIILIISTGSGTGVHKEILYVYDSVTLTEMALNGAYETIDSLITYDSGIYYISLNNEKYQYTPIDDEPFARPVYPINRFSVRNNTIVQEIVPQVSTVQDFLGTFEITYCFENNQFNIDKIKYLEE